MVQTKQIETQGEQRANHKRRKPKQQFLATHPRPRAPSQFHRNRSSYNLTSEMRNTGSILNRREAKIYTQHNNSSV